MAHLEEKEILQKSSQLQCKLIMKLTFVEEVLNQFKAQITGISVLTERSIKNILETIQQNLYKDKWKKYLQDQNVKIIEFLLSEPSREDLRHEVWSNLLIRNLAEILLSNLLSDITSFGKETLRASECTIYLISKEKDEKGRVIAELEAGSVSWKPSYPVVPIDQVEDHPISEDKKLGITGWVISMGRSFLGNSIQEILDHPHHIPPDTPDDRTLASFLAIPISTPRGEIIGVIKAESLDTTFKFQDEHQMFLETISLIVGRCVVHKQDFVDAKEKTNIAISSWALDVISEALAFEEELDNFLDIVVDVISAASLADSCAIFIIDEASNTLTQRAGNGNQELKKGIRAYILPTYSIDETAILAEGKSDSDKRIGLTPYIAKTGNSYYAENFEILKSHPFHKGKFDKENYIENESQCGAWFGVPLKVGSQTTGVLKIENESKISEKDNRAFSKEIRLRVDILAQNCALSIKRFNLRRNSRNEIFTQVQEVIVQILSGHEDIPTIVNKVVVKTKEFLKAQACALFLKEGDLLIQPQWAAVGWAQKGPKIRTYNLKGIEKILGDPRSSEKVGLTVWLALKGKKFTAKSNLELTMFPHHKGTYDEVNFEGDQRCESLMGCRLEVGGQLIGVLKVETKMREEQRDYTYFSEQDELVFDLIANSVAIAINNSRRIEIEQLVTRLKTIENQEGVVEELFKFCNNRQAVITTLTNTANQVKTDKSNPLKGLWINAFIDLLNSDFELEVFEMFKEIAEGDLKSWCIFVRETLNVNNIEDLNQLNSVQDNNLNNLLSQRFYLSNNLKVILKIRDNLLKKCTIEGKSNIERLKDCNKIFATVFQEITDYNKFNVFEQSVLRNIFNHWKLILEKSLSQYVLLTKITLKNTEFFGNLNWILSPQINILLGKNGFGKTNLLQLMASLLQNITNISEKYLIKQRTDAIIEMQLNIDDAFQRVTQRRKNIKLKGNKKQQKVVSVGITEPIPILAIPDTRFINKSRTSLSYLGDDDYNTELRKSGAYHFIYQKPLESVIQNFLYQICIDFIKGNPKSIIELEDNDLFEIHYRQNSENVKFTLLESIMQELTDVPFEFAAVVQMGQGQLKLKVKTEGSSMLLPIQHASQGTLSILSVFGLIYEFLRLMYPDTIDDKIRECHAIVFIDEIDAHLHPNWQQKVIGLLRRTFPNVQFIVTSYSPLVVAGCFENEVTVLQESDEGYIVKTFPTGFIGSQIVSTYNKVFSISEFDENFRKFALLSDEKINDLKDKCTFLMQKLQKNAISHEERTELEETERDLFYIHETKRLLEQRSLNQQSIFDNKILKSQVESLQAELKQLKSKS
jgi:predicted ATP-binding protein involved in virulence